MNKPSGQLTSDEVREAAARFTAGEFMAMMEAGLFEHWAGKVELADGVVVHMSPALNPHVYVQRQLFLKLHAVFGQGVNGYIALQEPTVRLSHRTVRDPDVAILRDVGPVRDFNKAGDALLIVEVAHTTLAEDRGPKRRSYAKAGIPNYWIVDVEGRSVELMTGPAGDDYKQRRTIAFGEPIPVPGTDAAIILD